MRALELVVLVSGFLSLLGLPATANAWTNPFLTNGPSNSVSTSRGEEIPTIRLLNDVPLQITFPKNEAMKPAVLREYQAKLAIAQAQYNRAKLALEAFQLQTAYDHDAYERAANLYKKSVIAEEDYLQAKLKSDKDDVKLKLLQTDIDETKANVDMVQAELDEQEFH